MKNSRALNRAGRWLKHNAPIFLSIAGAAGLIATAYLTAKETPEAKKVYDEGKEDAKTVMDKVCLTADVAKEYWPAIAVGAASIFCIIGSTVLSRKQQTALIGAYTLAQESYKKYRNSAKEVFGKDADDKIKAEMAKETVVYDCMYGSSVYSPDMEPNAELMTFYDVMSDRYFQSTISAVVNAQYHLNRNFAIGGCVSQNEYYSFLGIDKVIGGDEVGWDCSWVIEGCEQMWLDFDNKMAKIDDGTPNGMECCIVSPFLDPKPLDEWE